MEQVGEKKMWEVEINNILHKGSSIREEVQRQKTLVSCLDTRSMKHGPRRIPIIQNAIDHVGRSSVKARVI